MDKNNFFETKAFKLIILVIVACLLLLAGFEVGTIVGAKKAGFSNNWSDNYHRNFAGPRGGWLRGFDDREFMQANGSLGQIIKLDSSTIVIKDRDGVEKIVVADDNTLIKSFQQTIKLSDLKINDYIVVIGEPNNAGQIAAKFIRLMPPPPGQNVPPPASNTPPTAGIK
jgi:hypothetical protein